MSLGQKIPFEFGCLLRIFCSRKCPITYNIVVVVLSCCGYNPVDDWFFLTNFLPLDKQEKTLPTNVLFHILHTHPLRGRYYRTIHVHAHLQYIDYDIDIDYRSIIDRLGYRYWFWYFMVCSYCCFSFYFLLLYFVIIYVHLRITNK